MKQEYITGDEKFKRVNRDPAREVAKITGPRRNLKNYN
jgi:hypothetical protein